jgi:aspartyl-tRNA(Asn)/glutamyl-tRNA(Gln) amidotransferase subunit A
MGLGDEGLPLSLQIIGARGADGAVLAAAQHIEERIHDRASARRR